MFIILKIITNMSECTLDKEIPPISWQTDKRLYNLIYSYWLDFRYRPGRPPKRSSVTGIVSPVPSSFTSGPQQHNVVPYLGYPTAKKARFSDDTDYGSESKFITFNLILLLNLNWFFNTFYRIVFTIVSHSVNSFE